jgi:hypothetical protein
MCNWAEFFGKLNINVCEYKCVDINQWMVYIHTERTILTNEIYCKSFEIRELSAVFCDFVIDVFSDDLPNGKDILSGRYAE